MGKYYCFCGERFIRERYYKSHLDAHKCNKDAVNIIIHPSPNKKLNVNEMCFSKPYGFENTNSILIKDLDIPLISEWYKKFNKPIKSIVILIDKYGIFIENNIDFILGHKEITFYIHENDIHYVADKKPAYARYMLLRSQLEFNTHINILAYYWYHYKNVYKINPKNLICFPRFVFKENILSFNENPIKKILLSGAISKYYPQRRFLKNLNNPNVDVLSRNKGICGSDYNKYLNKYICGFACCSIKNTPYLVGKFFEIPAAGCLLLAFDEYIKEPMKELGFIDGENYISCNQANMVEKINYICDEKNINAINKIRKNGQRLIKERHSDKHRYELINTLISNT